MTLGLSALVAGGAVAALGWPRRTARACWRSSTATTTRPTASVFTWLTLAGGLAAVTSFLNYALTATRRFGHVLAVQLAAGAGALAIGVLRIPAAGVLGAAEATVAANLVALAVVSGLLLHAVGRRDV